MAGAAAGGIVQEECIIMQTVMDVSGASGGMKIGARETLLQVRPVS